MAMTGRVLRPLRARSVLWLLIATLASVLVLRAAPVRAVEPTPIEINVILSLTGNGAFLGNNEAAAIGLVERNTNKAGGIAGRPVHFTIADDQSNPQVDVQLATESIARNVSLIMGPTLASGCNAIRPLIKANGPLLYCLTPATRPEAGSFNFVYGPSTIDLVAVNVRYFHDLGFKKLALLSTTDATGQDGENAVVTVLKRPEFQDMTLVADEHFANQDQSVVAQLSRIKASGAQAMIAYCTGTPVGTVFHGMTEMGLDLPVGIASGNLIYRLMAQFADFLPPKMVATGLPSIAQQSLPRGPLLDAVNLYVNSFKAIGVRADIGHGPGWDPPLIVVSALKKVGANATALQLKNYIEGLHGFAGASGIYDFRSGNQRGLSESDGIMVRWDRAKQTWVAISKFGGTPLR